MLNYVFRALLTAFFAWALLSPFVDKEVVESGSEQSQTTPKGIPARNQKEKPLHNVKLPDFAAFTDVKEKKHAIFDFIRPHVEAENKRFYSSVRL